MLPSDTTGAIPKKNGERLLGVVYDIGFFDFPRVHVEFMYMFFNYMFLSESSLNDNPLTFHGFIPFNGICPRFITECGTVRIERYFFNGWFHGVFFF